MPERITRIVDAHVHWWDVEKNPWYEFIRNVAEATGTVDKERIVIRIAGDSGDGSETASWGPISLLPRGLARSVHRSSVAFG
jgi:hypothetical protein